MRETFQDFGREGGDPQGLTCGLQCLNAGFRYASGGVVVLTSEMIADRFDGVFQAVAFVLDSPHAIAAGAVGALLLFAWVDETGEALGRPAVDPDGAATRVAVAEDEG